MTRVIARTVDNRGLMFPMKSGPAGNDVTADLAIRRAVNVALDRKLLVAQVAAGFATPATGPADGLPWSNPDATLPDADPAAAEALLDAAGWSKGSDGVRRKGALKAEFPLVYFSTDSTRQMLAIAVADQLRRIGIVAQPAGKSSEEVRRLMHSSAVLFGWGSHNPIEVYYLHHSSLSGTGFYNAGFYANATVDAHLDRAQSASSLEESYAAWRAAAWDGTTGYGMRGDAAWAWLVNLDHVYLVRSCLDTGKRQIEPHGHGWPVTSNILDWRWTCP
jgi:peptide/nickel transport system substrate-binding protein